MKVYVWNDGKKIKRWVPDKVAFGNIKPMLSSRQIQNICKIIKQTKRKNGDWVFIEVMEKGQTIIKIIP